MTYKNKALENALKKIEALNTPEAIMARHNELMAARSAIMNASPRGRHFIAKYGDQSTSKINCQNAIFLPSRG